MTSVKVFLHSILSVLTGFIKRESIPPWMIPVWKGSSCLRCVACVGACPAGAIRFRENVIIIDAEVCTSCGTCIRICPVGAMEEGA